MIEPGFKGYPHDAPPRRTDDVAAQGWNVLAGDLPLPVALIRRSALEHNLAWMQRFARERGVDLAPHGKTTMSPQIFRRQLDAGAWGLTVANATQLAVAVAAGARRVVVANQVLAEADLRRIVELKALHDGLRVVFLLDSGAQLDLVEAWAEAHPGAARFEVLLELGVAGGRTGCRAHDDAVALARRVRAGRAARLVGVECYEGLWATGRSDDDAAFAAGLMDRVEALTRQCAAEQLFDTDEVLLSAGGSAIFDLVAGRLAPALGRPVRGLLRSGCYVTHDHGHYGRMLALVAGRCGCADTPRPALEVWAQVQSCPEPGLAIVAAGRRDLSFDMGLPVPFARAALGAVAPVAVPASWQVTGLNDQHAYLRWDADDAALAPVVGERIGLGISHPCTTFDKWRWMPVVDDDYRVVDAITTAF